MRRVDFLYKVLWGAVMTAVLALSGCANRQDVLPDGKHAEIQASEETMQAGEMQTEEGPQAAEAVMEQPQEKSVEPVIKETDWSGYFDGINGAAVIYDPEEKRYLIYNQELALTRRSPCSTFKIISSLTALEHGVVKPGTWSGEWYWNEEWNRDIDFADAFHASCVWYFREVIDEIGKDRMQKELDRLQYGNCDISDWEGRLNTNNNNRALTGFWIESSLLISPKEQTEVMERIFGGQTGYTEETLNQLRQVMRLHEENDADRSIYGKTGMGKADGVVVDAWFTGFSEKGDKRVYFCVYLGETENKDVSSVKAREAAIEIVTDYWQAPFC